MEIEVKLFATLRDYLPNGSDQFSCKLEVNSTDTVGDVLKKLKIPEEIPKIILVNGVHSNLDRVLKLGDILSVFPPVAGG
jgi:molybdopterin synthase sulfur carrier subunit